MYMQSAVHVVGDLGHIDPIGEEIVAGQPFGGLGRLVAEEPAEIGVHKIAFMRGIPGAVLLAKRGSERDLIDVRDQGLS